MMPAISSSVAGASGAEIDRTLGTNFGDCTADGGLAAAYDGTTNQTGTSCARTAGSVTACYVGKTGDVSRYLSKVTIYGSNNNGYVSSANPSVTANFRAQVGGSAPANAAAAASAGVLLGSITFTDSANESTGRDITSSDTTTLYDHWWVSYSWSGAQKANIAEHRFYE